MPEKYTDAERRAAFRVIAKYMAGTRATADDAALRVVRDLRAAGLVISELPAKTEQPPLPDPPPVDRSARCLTDGSPVTDDHREIDPRTGQQKGYVVLTPAERAKGFVRPVRRSYRHVGARPQYPTRDLTAKEARLYPIYAGGKWEEYPQPRPDGLSVVGRYWTAEQLASGCGAVTTMGVALAETYARDPAFYSGTFCATCGKHLPLAEFVWEGTSEVVGS